MKTKNRQELIQEFIKVRDTFDISDKNLKGALRLLEFGEKSRVAIQAHSFDISVKFSKNEARPQDSFRFANYTITFDDASKKMNLLNYRLRYLFIIENLKYFKLFTAKNVKSIKHLIFKYFNSRYVSMPFFAYNIAENNKVFKFYFWWQKNELSFIQREGLFKKILLDFFPTCNISVFTATEIKLISFDVDEHGYSFKVYLIFDKIEKLITFLKKNKFNNNTTKKLEKFLTKNKDCYKELNSCLVVNKNGITLKKTEVHFSDNLSSLEKFEIMKELIEELQYLKLKKKYLNNEFVKNVDIFTVANDFLALYKFF